MQRLLETTTQTWYYAGGNQKMKYTSFAVSQAARAAGIPPETASRLLAHLSRVSSPSPDHRLKYPRRRQSCSFPRELSVAALIEAPLSCEFFIPLDKMRDRSSSHSGAKQTLPSQHTSIELRAGLIRTRRLCLRFSSLQRNDDSLFRAFRHQS